MAVVHKLLKIYTQTKLNDEFIDKDSDKFELIRYAEKENNLYAFGKDIHFCMYKIKDTEPLAVIMIFTIRLPNTNTSSSVSNDAVIKLIGDLEEVFTPIHSYNYCRNVEGIGKNVGVLTVVKKIRESDIL